MHDFIAFLCFVANPIMETELIWPYENWNHRIWSNGLRDRANSSNSGS